ncbi:MAG: glycosyltransferase family 4 protein [Candidatus Peribacteraceae bacterium]|jgi:glycosyltransferase involved in cell wall biosynthesis|nr:hypothetical protein [Parcubacteria group bacterium]MDP6575325.1 glycosyltransferase family 4 protein [Candidatus Peribacteraceae bacterium]HCI04180.1 hypothetical protein [Candidatus Peribacteria bacterium]|tara:strand:- start:141 stop:1259 length:1119 start_codon:yes stop_codon:yes gene_type:complete
MRVTYVVHTRFPAEKAYGLQIAAVCKALAEIGHDVTIIAPHTKNYINQPIHEYYELPGSVKFVRMKNFDALGKWWIPGPLWMVITMFFYRRKLKKFLKNHQAEILYVRSPLILKPLITSGIPVVLELHTISKRFKKKFVSMCNKCKKVVCLTSPMRDEVRKLGVDESKLIVEGDGVDFDEFQNLPSTSNEVPVIGYVGSLATQDKIEKGVPELLRSLKELKDRGAKVSGWIVGGPDDWKKSYSDLADSLGISEIVKFEGRVERSEVPSVISKCDVCVYPAPATDHPFIMRDTSPLKLVEYLAAGKPIVCADIPPVRDIVDESIVEFCVPGDSKSMADAIERALEGSSKPQSAQERAKKYDWKERMKRIVVPL